MEPTNQKDKGVITRSFFDVYAGFILFFAIIFFIWLLKGLLAPVFLALLLAYIFSPLITMLETRLKWPRILLIIMVLLTFVIFIAGLVILIVPLASQQTTMLIENAPDYIEKLLPTLNIDNAELTRKISDNPKEVLQKILPMLIQGTVKSVNMFTSAVTISGYIVLYILLLLVFFITFSLYMPCFPQWASRFFPQSKRRHILELLDRIHQTAIVFLRTRLIVAAVLSVLFSMGWAFVGVPYWFLVGTISGILSIIPYAAAIGWLVAVLFNTLEAETNTSAVFYSILWPTVVYGAVQFLEGWFLTPYLQSEKLEIHPVTVLFVVLAGGVLGGILGMLIAIPLTAAFKIIYSDVIENALLKWADKN